MGGEGSGENVAPSRMKILYLPERDILYLYSLLKLRIFRLSRHVLLNIICLQIA